MEINIGCTGLKFKSCAQTFDLNGSSAKKVCKNSYVDYISLKLIWDLLFICFIKNLELCFSLSTISHF